MKGRLAVALLAATTIVAASALADSTDTTACEPGYQCLHAITIYGRPTKPIVVVELVRPTAAHEAGAAHEQMKVEWLKKAEPKTLHSSSSE